MKKTKEQSELVEFYKKTKSHICIPKEWFQGLSELADKVKKDQDKWNLETDNPLMPESVSKLIGYASSADLFLRVK